MASFAAARSVFHSSSVKNVAGKLGAGVKPATSAARTSSIKLPSSSLTFRYRGVSSSVFIKTMVPFHTATASTVLTSLLSTSRCGAWLPEGNKFFRCSHSATNGTPRYMKFFASSNAAWLEYTYPMPS